MTEVICVQSGRWVSLTHPNTRPYGPSLNEIVSVKDMKVFMGEVCFQFHEYQTAPDTGLPAWYPRERFAKVMTDDDLAANLSGLAISIRH